MNQTNIVLSNGELSLQIDPLRVKKSAMVIRALNHKLRQQMIKLIDEVKTITVTDIYVRLRLEQSVASQHLAVLRKVGIVATKRDGKKIFYSVNYHRLQHILNTSNNLLN
ncbi:MAG TPA: metalloregulator ArsR/SmtB family transcription factor [Chitinophagaceae bacterium]|nr:metalloregulator ArsR/SmtB family transcription factor [Chitinophagaceae bacterium]HNE92828.1 metalloregulator ArsR/SmtB family transcription factor [Chitinophagaceae bacterium]HNF28728.1 metalloregulator ArsR/SmtB family transcription factor [Chitinophagaceae bacterium]HNM33282.1 metalloregulator ArsR/SmtB family transcription factor [Chitinophagaceae bacterium]HNN30250.1 metalloregulator ArsR/SmtB family transcription factor [Chitinophagaceae bacterium]